MKTYFATCAIFAAFLGVSVTAISQDSHAKSSHAAASLKESTITAKIEPRLPEDLITSLGDIHVDTDENGVVWLSGTARTHEAAIRAIAIARATAHVKKVHSTIRAIGGEVDVLAGRAQRVALAGLALLAVVGLQHECRPGRPGYSTCKRRAGDPIEEAATERSRR